jgi:hypothetical protein
LIWYQMTRLVLVTPPGFLLSDQLKLAAVLRLASAKHKFS